jgi:hypothetical protein
MADIKATSLGGIPKGTTAQRPTSPAIGDVFYNGTLGCLDIYTSQGWVANSAPPAIPTIGAATNQPSGRSFNNGQASVAFSPGEGGGLPNSYRATSSPGGFSASGSVSPILVTGLQSNTAYTFSVTGTNNFGTSAASANSSSITATTIPDIPGTPVAAYVSNTSATLTFTAGSTGGSSITNYKYSLDGTNYTTLSPAQSSSPLTITGLTALTNYTFYIKAVNENGDSVSSAISNSIFTGPVASGGILTSDSTYYYRTFTGTGALSISNQPITADYLLVAGGGGSGFGNGTGGGGAGGYLSGNMQLATSSYSIVVGSGGAGTQTQSVKGGNGINSTALGLTSIGGGGCGSEGFQSGNGAVGGSGGGGVRGGSGAAGTSGQGNSGGSNVNDGAPYYSGGGGGGAGAAGTNGSNNTLGVGGNGLQWVNGTYYAGGGGGAPYSNGDGLPSGGAGGLGGGAQGGTNPSDGRARNGSSNTGGGGSGSGLATQTYINGNGGSGVFIIRYTKSQVGG